MIFLGSDHGGFKLKGKIKKYLNKLDYQYKDMGAIRLDEIDDYPKYAFLVSQKVGCKGEGSWKAQNKGILFCRSAGGVVIAANKVKGVRAVAVYDVVQTVHAREHNNANIIAIAGDWTNETLARKIVKIFLETEFSSQTRHKRRIDQISKFENKVKK